MSRKTKSTSPDSTDPGRVEDRENPSNESTTPPAGSPLTGDRFVGLSEEQLRLLTSKCSISEDENGKILHVPLDLFSWVICLPHTSIIRISGTPDMPEKMVIPRIRQFIKDDWSDHVEIFHGDKMLEPISRLKVEIDRDKNNFPKIKWEVG